ncbi:MAG: transcription elongation factor GreA [Flavobacteriaceae bacterium]
MSKLSYYTAAGLIEIRAELEQLEMVDRPNITQAIADARDKGDLSENAEYHAAKEEQSHLEYKIAKLKNVVANARLIDESDMDLSKVLALSKVKLKNLTTNKEFEYTLVADAMTNIKEGKISINSPIGKGLLGKEVGDIAEIQVPVGIMKLEILNISR